MMKQMVLFLALTVGVDGLETNRWTGYPHPNEAMQARNLLTIPASMLTTGFPLEVSQQIANKDNVRQFDSALPIRSSIERVWEVLTDYENIEKFQPGIEKSGLLESLPSGEKQLEQTMVQRFLFSKNVCIWWCVLLKSRLTGLNFRSSKGISISMTPLG
jgi:hypothetical protein